MSRRVMIAVTCVMLFICLCSLAGVVLLRANREQVDSQATPAPLIATARPRLTPEPIQLSGEQTTTPMPKRETNEQVVTISSVTGRDAQKAADLLEKNKNRCADILSKIYTQQNGVVFTFSVENEETTRAVLTALDRMNAKATFFFMPQEYEQKRSLLQSIASAGHEIGLSLNGARYVSSQEMLLEVLETETSLHTEVGFSGKIPLRATHGLPSTMLRIVASAGGYTLVHQTKTVSLERSLAVLENEGKSTIFTSATLQRGDIVDFDMAGTSTPSSIRASLEAAAGKSRYPVMRLSDMVASQDRFIYPVSTEDMLSGVVNKIRPGTLAGDPLETIEKRYIGVEWNKNPTIMPGFTQKEISKLDKSGAIKTTGKQVFLTFDGWGDEERLDQLLEVLAAHKVYATFFVRSADAVKDPTFLREIAQAGHPIGSNTHTGMSLATYVSKGKFENLTDKEAAALKEDVVKSYNTLANIVGDLTMGESSKEPALTTLFRPPLLTVSRAGLEAVLGCGYTYSVSGAVTFETKGYKSAEEVTKAIKSKIKAGRILIFHLDNLPSYYIEGLDEYLTQNEKASSPFVFTRLTEVL